MEKMVCLQFYWNRVIGGIHPLKHFRGSASACFLNSLSFPSLEIHGDEKEVVIALGSNMGNRNHNFSEALRLMSQSGVKVARHGGLYETPPVYVTDQPHFLNSAVRCTTKHGPHELLQVLKKIEKEMGRISCLRYGPRQIDLDILFYGNCNVHSSTLTIPHERIFERPFVMAPLVDLLGSDVDDDATTCWRSLAGGSCGIFESWEKLGGDSLVGKGGMRRVMPIGDYLWDWSQRTRVMGILNLTRDSFSDGGKFKSVEDALSHVRTMISQGADIIDLGAQSTRPMASRIPVQEELDRLIPVLEAVISMPEMERKLASVDTFYSEVASEAVGKGAHLVNDVSGGKLDPNMMKTVARLGVPYVVMHMRGDPATMQSRENVEYDDVCKQVALELCSRITEAELSGIPAWRIIVDPGIGFSKKTEDNLRIIAGLRTIRSEMRRKSIAASHAPVLIGPSRKRFLGEICGRSIATERDWATIASVTAGVMGGANIVRVHQVQGNVDAVRFCDAMLKYSTGTV